MSFKSIIWDLGGVLIDWNPAYVFDQLFEDEEKKQYFFQHVCTSDWNEEQDAGRSIRLATEELIARHPEWRTYIEAYYGRWTEMLKGPIPESVAILKELKDSKRFQLYALTNWSAELFPIALERFDFLHWFDGRVVSGEERMRKPFPEFYHLLLNRYQLQPNEVLFIDDNLRNIRAAEEIGIHSIHFHSPQQLRERLEELAII